MTTNSQWVSPPYVAMCEICFESLKKEDCARDKDGILWDVCKGDCARDSGLEEWIEYGTPEK